MKVTLIKENNIPNIYITASAQRLMEQLVANCDDEIGWLALSKKDGENDYLIYDIEICEQECGATHTDLMEGGLQEIANRYINNGRIDEMNNVRVWCHSHVNMEVSPSGQDEQTFEQYYKDCDDYFIRIIMNKKGKWNTSIVDIENGIRYDDMPVYTIYEGSELALASRLAEKRAELQELEEQFEEIDKVESEVAKAEAKALIKEYVKTKTYYPKHYNSYGNYGYGNYGYYSDKNRYSYAYNTPTKTEEKEEEKEKNARDTFLNELCLSNPDKYKCKDYYLNGDFRWVSIDTYFDMDEIEYLAQFSFQQGLYQLQDYAITEGYTMTDLEDLLLLLTEIYEIYEDEFVMY